MPDEKIEVILVFPEDLGGSLDSGHTSIWELQEFRSFEGFQGVHVAQSTSARLENLTT